MAPNRKKLFFTKKKEQRLAIDAEIFKLEELYKTFDSSTAKTFDEFPLSKKTHMGLKAAGFINPTDIQRESIGFALKGHDILGAAKTGSGKTLAFLIPVFEKLFRQKWSNHDGLGALIITPTRELACQIFEVMKKAGQKHDFSAGLIIGGKDLQFERKRVDKCNIIIGTPGRLLQHFEQNFELSCNDLQILVLDEADRILDLGFEEAMNAILSYLKTDRQTLLFSATQTKSVKDLARLSLKNPVYVSVHEHSVHSTPELLRQGYVVCELHEKFNLLWSFLRHYSRQKILVFLSTCKQVKFISKAFHLLSPRSCTLALYGKMHQTRRMTTFETFQRKQSAILFATDIAARGLDFPVVNWVVQLDCPEDADTYIHRVGRTARYQKGGDSLLVLLPSEEEAMVENLQKKKIPVKKINVNPEKNFNCGNKLQIILTKDNELKQDAQRALVAYFKSVFLMKDKKVFDVLKLDKEKFAHSLGLLQAPEIRILNRAEDLQRKKKERNAIAKEFKVENDKIGIKSEQQEEKQSSNRNPLCLNDGDSDEDLFTVKKVHLPDESAEEEMENVSAKSKKIITKFTAAKKLLKRKIKPSNKIIFDEEGNEIAGDGAPRKLMSDVAKKLLEEDNEIGGIDIEKTKLIMQEEDKIDKEIARQRIKKMHRLKRLKEKELRRNAAKGSDPEKVGVQLGEELFEEEEEENDDEESRNSGSEEEEEEEDEASTDSEVVESSDVEEEVMPRKKQKIIDNVGKLSLADEENLALQLLSRN